MDKKNLPSKICVVCARAFYWRKKWEKTWEEVKYCSERCRGNRQEKIDSLSDPDQIERIVRMAWEDRTPFDAIEYQFGLNEKQVIELMRKTLTEKRFIAWRERVQKNGSLKEREKRGFKVGVFKSSMQRIDGTLKSRKR
jgi:uncharacterized protein (TIGR03643 family)